MFCWTVHQAPRHYGPAAVVVEHEVYSFGGSLDSNNDQIEVGVFHTPSLRGTTLPPVTNERGEGPLEVPSRRYGHTAVLIEYVIYIWGGTPFCNLLYGFDVDAHRWVELKISGTVPEARYHHSACALGKVMYIHGGCLRTGQTNHIYKFDTSTMVWSLLGTRGTTPPVSSSHSATIIGTKMFVIGGFGGYVNNGIRVFDTETHCWLSVPSAQPLSERHCRHSTVAYNGELYVYGHDHSNNLNDVEMEVWKFNPVNFTWKKIKPKGNGPSQRYGMCCCTVGDRIILFGGYKGLYILDLVPTLKTLCKLAVIHYGVEQKELPHNIRWELKAMTRKVQMLSGALAHLCHEV